MSGIVCIENIVEEWIEDFLFEAGSKRGPPSGCKIDLGYIVRVDIVMLVGSVDEAKVDTFIIWNCSGCDTNNPCDELFECLKPAIAYKR